MLSALGCTALGLSILMLISLKSFIRLDDFYEVLPVAAPRGGLWGGGHIPPVLSSINFVFRLNPMRKC